MKPKPRMGFGEFIDDVLKVTIVGIAAWGVSSLSELNKNVAVIVSQIQVHDKVLDRHEEQLSIVRDYISEHKK